MTFEPVLHPLLLGLIFIPALAFTVWLAVRASTGARGLWLERCGIVLLCLLMLLRPGIPGGSTKTLSADTDILLVVDTTASIVAEDWGDGQQRLDGIRDDVQQMIDAYPGARFALITFDAAAVLRLPFTTDTNAVSTSLDVLQPEVTRQSRGSSISIANDLITETLQNAADVPDGQSPRSRMVFYFGDGEQTVTDAPKSFAGAVDFVDGGAVLGYGTAEGGPMQITTGLGSWYQGDPEYIEYEGQPARSVIDEANLQTIAEQLGVDYMHRSADEALALPQAPTSSKAFDDADGVAASSIELYWVCVLALIALLGFELARATYLITRMRGLAVREEGRR